MLYYIQLKLFLAADYDIKYLALVNLKQLFKSQN